MSVIFSLHCMSTTKTQLLLFRSTLLYLYRTRQCFFCFLFFAITC